MLKKRSPPLDHFCPFCPESRQLALFSFMILDLALDILPFLSAKDLKKFGCVHNLTQLAAQVQKHLNAPGQYMLSEDKMLFDISDILGKVTKGAIQIYTENPFNVKAAWRSSDLVVSGISSPSQQAQNSRQHLDLEEDAIDA